MSPRVTAAIAELLDELKLFRLAVEDFANKLKPADSKEARPQ
jgi:hypothetical protein